MAFGMSSARTLRKECPVFTADGEHIGRIKETAGESFKVDVPWHADYWLSRDIVRSVDEKGRVLLRVSSDELDRYQRDVPSMGGGYDPEQRSERNRPRDEDEAGYPRYDRGGAWSWEDRTRGGMPRSSYERPRYDSPAAPRSYAGDIAARQQTPRYDQGEYESGLWSGRRDWIDDSGGDIWGYSATYAYAPGAIGSRDYASGPYAGIGPRGYTRADERIREDICERLTNRGDIDAGDVEVDVKGAEVTLRGSVDTRYAKRMAEDVAESVSGVKQVHNELKMAERNY